MLQNNGNEKIINIQIKCPQCQGEQRVKIDGLSLLTCGVCEGAGTVNSKTYFIFKKRVNEMLNDV